MDPYPDTPMDPGNWGGGSEQTPLSWKQVQAAREDNHNHFTDERNMDRALVTRCMDSLNPNAVQSFQHELQRDLNQSLCDVFHWFLGRYGASNKMEQQCKRTRMEANWNPSN